MNIPNTVEQAPNRAALGNANWLEARADPTVLIRSLLPSLPNAERRVAKVILAHPTKVLSLTIGAIANAASTSDATVVRFSKKAGFAGYPDLRIALAAEVGRSTLEGRETGAAGLDILPEDSLGDIVAKVGALDAQAINNTVAHLDLDTLACVVEAVCTAERIEIYGIGASGLIALDLEQKLRRIGLRAAVSRDGHAALTSAAVLPLDGVAIGISHSGATLDVVDALLLAQSRGATTVAIVNFSPSALTRAANLSLTTATRESELRSGEIASRSAQLTVVDCIYLGVAQRNYDSALAAINRTSEAVRSRQRSTRESE